VQCLVATFVVYFALLRCAPCLVGSPLARKAHRGFARMRFARHCAHLCPSFVPISAELLDPVEVYNLFPEMIAALSMFRHARAMRLRFRAACALALSAALALLLLR
jgi:hypothetical protein